VGIAVGVSGLAREKKDHGINPPLQKQEYGKRKKDGGLKAAATKVTAREESRANLFLEGMWLGRLKLHLR